jgi:hypothetical protein
VKPLSSIGYPETRSRTVRTSDVTGSLQYNVPTDQAAHLLGTATCSSVRKLLLH